MPVKPPDQPGVVTEGSLPAKRSAVRTTLVPASGAGWTVDLEALPTSLWPAQHSTLTATANMDVGPAHYLICIWDSKIAGYIAQCPTGTTCSASVTRANADFTSFTATIMDGGVDGLCGGRNSLAVASSFADVDWHGAGVRMTETAPTVPVGGTITLTAITDYDIGTSPFFVEIYDITAATILTRCGVGTRCAVTVSQTTATTHRYRACFAVASSSFPPPNALECTVDHAASWASTSRRIVLTVTPIVPGMYTVTALATDVGPTPNVIAIYTLESGFPVAVCGMGTICSTSVFSGANDQTLVGFVGPFSATLPPPAPPGVDQSNSLSVPVKHCPLPSGCQGAPVVSGPVLGPPGVPKGTMQL
jgi:hypothetical protein